MRMQRMGIEKFLSYILDNRKQEVTPENAQFEVFYHNPSTAHGDVSSFVFVVLVSRLTPYEVWCGGAKYNTLDQNLPGGGFDLEEGLKQACNRAWTEYRGMKSLYGKNHGPQPRKSSDIAKAMLFRHMFKPRPYPVLTDVPRTFKKFSRLRALARELNKLGKGGHEAIKD
jgi:hypothetical protein